MDNFPTGHNSFCSLGIPTKKKFKVFVSMIKGLQTCPLSHAISTDPEIHYTWVKQFWENAKTIKDGSKITSEVEGVKVKVTEEVIRQALKIKDTANDPCTIFSDKQIANYLKEIGYEVDRSICEKKYLPNYWKLLFHIVANCLSNIKSGFDRLNGDWVGVMLSLTKRESYNYSNLFFRYFQHNVLARNRKMMYPRFIQLILDHLLPDTPKPVRTDKIDDQGKPVQFFEPFHVKEVKQVAMTTILKPTGKSSHKYRGKQPGPKIDQFVETESDMDDAIVGDDGDDLDDGHDGGEDSNEDEEQDDEQDAEQADDSDDAKREHRSKNKHDKKKKGKVGESSRQSVVDSEEEEDELERPLKRLKETKDSKKSLTSMLPRLKVHVPLTSEMVSHSLVTQTTSPQITTSDPHIGSPKTLAITLKTLQDKQIKITKTTTKVTSPKAPNKPRPKLHIRKRPAPQKLSLVDQPITPLETSPAHLDEPMPSILENISTTTQIQTSTTPRTTSPIFQFTSPIKETSFWTSTFTTSSLTETTSTTIETTTTPTSLPLVTTTLFPTITMPVPTTQQTTIATAPPSTHRSHVINITSISSGKSKKSPVFKDPILDRLAALEEANKSRAQRELKVIQFIKDQKAINQEVTRQRDALADQLASLQETHNALITKNTLQNDQQHADMKKFESRMSKLEVDLPSTSQMVDDLRKELEASLKRVLLDYERLDSKVGSLGCSENQEVRRLMGESERLRTLAERLQGQIEEERILQGRVNDSFANRHLAVLEVMKFTSEDVENLRIHLMGTYQKFLHVNEPRAERVNNQQTVLAHLATDAEGVRAQGSTHSFLYTGGINTEGGSGSKDVDEPEVVVGTVTGTEIVVTTVVSSEQVSTTSSTLVAPTTSAQVSASTTLIVHPDVQPVAHDDDDDDNDNDDKDEDEDDEDDNHEYDDFDEPRGDGNGDGTGGSGSGSGSGNVDATENKIADVEQTKEAKTTKETEDAMNAELDSVLNAYSFAGTAPIVQEAVEENNDDDGINYSPNPDTPPTGENVEPTVDKHVVTPVAAPVRGRPIRGIVYHSVSRMACSRSRSKPYHDSDPILYAKFHKDSQRWAIRRANGDLTYLTYEDMHSLSIFDMNYFRRTVARDDSKDNLESWFKKTFLRKEWRNDYPSFKLNSGRSFKVKKINPFNNKPSKERVYRMPDNHEPEIFHGMPFEDDFLYDFIAWEFDNEHGEVIMHCTRSHELRFFDEHELAGFGLRDLRKLVGSPLCTVEDVRRDNTDAIVGKFNKFVRLLVEKKPFEENADGVFDYESKREW